MPRMNLWGFKKEPSPEMLAGSGPSVTYPTPPSQSATPEAIASVAGGTARPDTAGNALAAASGPMSTPAAGIQPGYALPGGQRTGTPTANTPTVSTPTAGNQIAGVPSGIGGPSAATPPNFAAARSNGFGGPAVPSTQIKPGAVPPPPNYAATGETATPPGYTFGKSGTTSASTVAATSPMPSPQSINPKPPGPAAPTTYSLSAGTKGVSGATAGSPSSGGGFQVPGSFAAAPAAPAAGFAPPPAATTTAAASTAPTGGGFAIPSMPTPAPKTIASVPPSLQNQPPAAATSSQPGSMVRPVSGYSPGSTSATSGYPGGGTIR